MALFRRIFNLHDPTTRVRRQSNHSKIAAGFHHRALNAELTKFFNCAIDGITFRDAAQVERHARASKTHRSISEVELNQPKVYSRQNGVPFRASGQTVFLPDEAPELGQRTDCRIERA